MNQNAGPDISKTRAMPRQALESLKRFPPLSPAASKLYSLAGRDSDLRQIASVISTDPALTTAVLRLVNSPIFAVSRQLTNVLQATALIGLDRLRALATTAALRMLVTPASATPELKRCWRHSVACAYISQEMAAAAGGDRNLAYVAGLLHDIGCFAMLRGWPKEYSQVLATARPSELLEAEAGRLGFDHCEAGYYLLQQWAFPADLALVARDHHRIRPDRQADLVAQVSCACRLADQMGFGITAVGDSGETLEQETAQFPLPDTKEFFFRVADCINQVEYL